MSPVTVGGLVEELWRGAPEDIARIEILGFVAPKPQPVSIVYRLKTGRSHLSRSALAKWEAHVGCVMDPHVSGLHGWRLRLTKEIR